MPIFIYAPNNALTRIFYINESIVITMLSIQRS